jgi:putative tricarboxylic transport membrane protein
VYATLSQFPKPLLIPLILMLAIIGAYAARANPYDIVIMLFLGVLGFGMIVVDMPTAPLVIAFILTPMVEENLRRALIMNPGNPGKALFGSPLAIGLILAMVVLVFFTVQFLKKVEE